MAENISLINVLFLVAIALLVLVSGGVIYLTALEWRDRRVLDRNKRNENKRKKK